MSNYIPIRIKTLRGESTLDFDVYINLKDDHYVHYLRKDDEIDSDRISKLKEKKIKKVFILEEHEDDYLTYLDKGLTGLADDSMDVGEKAGLVNDTMVTVAENAESIVGDEKKFNQTKDQFDKITDFLMSEKGALKSILDSADASMDDHQHAATVSSLSLGLASAVGGMDSKEMMELGLASLLHDIGKNRLKFDHSKEQSEMTPEELKQYHMHPQDGADMLAGKEFISPRILGLVADHEEIGNKLGPNKKDYFSLGMPYKILNLCNAFDRFCRKNSIANHDEALDGFMDEYDGKVDDELFATLATLLQ